LFRVKFDSTELNKILNNSVSYSIGYIEGIEKNKNAFYIELAKCTLDTLNKYIDSQSRVNPDKLHHVYEWNMIGEERGRLFKFNTTIGKNNITFNGNFLPSKTVSSNSNEPFINKAYVMENAITVEISPKNSDVLVFENNGETVFTRNTIYVEHPGGQHVENGFGDTIDNFFSEYFTYAILQPILNKLSKSSEYEKNFVAGTKIGKSVGKKAGEEYLMSSVRMTIE
jgi:hypothetical protein